MPASGHAQGPENGQRPDQRLTHAARRERRAGVADPAVVLEAAARFLEVRARSVAEVRRRLTGAGYRPDLVEATIERLLDLRLLDDEAFARAWLESRERSRPRGERAIRHELAQKGVDREIVEHVLDERRDSATEAAARSGEVVPSPDEAAAARLLVRHERALARIIDPRQRRQRAYALLARNGFGPDVCRALSATVVTADVGSDADGTEDGRA